MRVILPGMTHRLDPEGRPAGLDWDTISANCPQDPSVWSKAARVKTKSETETRPEGPARASTQRVPDAVAAEIVRLYTELELSGAQIGIRTGVRPATVYKVLRRNGIEPRTKGGKARTDVAA